MKSKQILRESLGFSQKAFAQYLFIPSSQLAMYESGKRDLPTATLLQIAEMSVFLDQEKPAVVEQDELKKELESELYETLLLQAKELQYKQLKEQRLLDAIVKKYNQNSNLYYFAKYANKNRTEQDKVLAEDALKEIKKNSLAVQFQQQLKLKSVKSQLEYVEIELKRYEKT